MASPQRIDFDDSAHFPAIFGGNAGGVIVRSRRRRLVSGPKLGESIVSKRDAVDDELRLVLRATRMEYGVPS